MATRTVIELIDDLDGSEAAETVSFALDGAAYEIDLSSANAKKLRDALQPFTDHARKGKAGAQGGDRSKSRSSRTLTDAENRERSADIRAWAKARGIKVNERGRIPASVADAYEADAQRGSTS